VESTFGSQYDQHKVGIGAEDELLQDDGPYRYLKHWYFYDRRHGPNSPRLPLPTSKVQLPKNYVLAGWLQPRTGGTEPIFVTLDNAGVYCLDFVPPYRGYWVYTQDSGGDNRALYWLQEACDAIPMEDGSTIASSLSEPALSQEDLYWPHRITLAIVSLLNNNINSWDCDASVEQMLRQKSLLQTKATSAENLFQIEVNILAKYKATVKMFLAGEFAEYPNCKFMESLAALRVRNVIPTVKLHRWTEGAERQLGQFPWGGPIDGGIAENGALVFPALRDREIARCWLEHHPLPDLDNNQCNDRNCEDEEEDEYHDAYASNNATSLLATADDRVQATVAALRERGLIAASMLDDNSFTSDEASVAAADDDDDSAMEEAEMNASGTIRTNFGGGNDEGAGRQKSRKRLDASEGVEEDTPLLCALDNNKRQKLTLPLPSAREQNGVVSASANGQQVKAAFPNALRLKIVGADEHLVNAKELRNAAVRAVF
jgi:hypothetical protein